MPETNPRHSTPWLFLGLALLLVLTILRPIVVTWLHAIDGVRNSRAHADATQLGFAVQHLHEDTGSTDAECLSDLRNLTTPPLTDVCRHPIDASDSVGRPQRWAGPYLPAATNDPWNNAYRVLFEARAQNLTVSSNGPDGAANTADDISLEFTLDHSFGTPPTNR